MSDEITLSAKQIADIKSVSVQAIHKRAAKERWPHVQTVGRGGAQRRYILSELPDDIRILYNKEQLTESIPAQLPAVRQPSAIVRRQAPEVIAPAQRDKALARYDLLRLYTERIKSAPYGKKTVVRDDFMRAYNTGLLYPALFQTLGLVSWKTIEAWKLDCKSARNDAFVLVDNRGAWRRGATSIEPAHERILLQCLLHPHQPRIAEAIRTAREIMHARGIENGFSDATYRRWICEWRERNHHIWTYTREGWKAWNDTCALSGERDYDAIEVGDLVVADGHVLNFEIINPWTGKPKRMTLLQWIDMKSTYPLGWQIMPTENTQAIAAAMRWSILRLGKIPKLAYIDNGKAFGARFFEGRDLEHDHFSGLFERLGMQVIHARPYRGQSKTIERFFGTFSELERFAPTFTGTSIATKPPGMMRGEKLHRRLREQMIGGGITLEQAHIAIADWFDTYARRPQQDGHLKGIAPIEIFEAGRGPGVDRALLDDLMMSTEIKSIRRSAISFMGRQYYHRELHGRTHRVLIHYDFQDPSFIRVSELDGTPICTAEPYEKLHPAAGYLGTEEDVARLARHCEEHRHQEKEASALASRFLRDEVLPAHRAQMDRIGLGPQPVAAKQRPVLVTGTPARRAIPETTISDEQWQQIQADAENPDVYEITAETACDIEQAAAEAADNCIEDGVALRARLESLSEPERYEALLEIEARGILLGDRWRDYMRYFEHTTLYLNDPEHYENLRGLLAVQWQTESPASAGCVTTRRI